jgi:hypothetical protein
MTLLARLSALLFAALFTVGCQGITQPSFSPLRSESPGEPTLAAASPVAPLTSLDPAWSAAQAISCGDDLFFSPAVLMQPAHEEEGTDPAAIALRTYLATPAPEELAARPDIGWHRVAQTATQVQFAGLEKNGRAWFFVGFMLANGTWTEGSSGTCAGTVRRGPGLVRADWWLDPRFDAPQDTDDLVQAVLLERSCASGHSPEGRIAPPSIAYFENAIVVTMSVQHRPGGQDCAGNPEFRFKLRLDQAVGRRRLLDGSVFPPRDAAKPTS